MKLPNLFQKLTILGLTLLAFFLRTYRLDAQSYWIDEAWTVFFSGLSLDQLWHLLQTTEIIPPFYQPSVHYWVKLAGNSEYGLRFYSVVFGVMAVPFTYRLGKDLGDDRLGLMAALLMAVAPYQIWHAQEARMYSILTASSVMSMWGFVNVWQQGGWRWWLVYVTGTEWAILTHYHGLVLIGIQGLFLLLTWRRHWQGYLRWGGTLVVIFLLYLPWLIFGSNLLQSYLSWLKQPTLWDSYVRSAIAYSVGELVPRAQAIPLALVFVLIYGLGLLYAARRRWVAWRGPEMLAFLLAYTLAPNLAAWVYGQLRTTVYFERYLILVQTGFLLTIAMGVLAVVDGLWPQNRPASFHQGSSPLRLLAAMPVLLLPVGISGWVLYHHYFDPLYAKPNWRAVAKTIETFELPGDAILLTGDGGELAFNFYYKGDLPVYFNFNLPLPTSPAYRQGRKSLAEVDQIMADIAAKHRRIWYTPYGADIDPTLESWLAGHAYPAWHSWIGRKQLALYGTGQQVTGRQEVVNATFTGEQRTGPTLLSAALPDTPIAAGELLPLKLIWQTASTLARDYQLSLRLINGRGDIFAQNDWPPLAAMAGTSTWPTNQPVTDRRSLWLPPDTPPGSYALQFVVYDPASGQPLGQPATIPNITVGPAATVVPPEALSIPNLGQRPLNNLNLVGYALPEKIQPGQEMWLWLYWQAQQPPAPDNVLRISLNSGKETVTADFGLPDSAGPVDAWQAGQVRRAVYHLPTSPRLSGQTATVSIALMTAAGQVAAETTLAQLALETRPRQFDVPAMAYTTDIAFGNAPQLKLIGYDLPATQLAAGDILPVTLYWQSLAEMDLNYTVFVQLLNPAGQVVAQLDLQPQAGAAPTTTWLPTEIVTDAYTLPLPNLPPGDYRLITGLYNAATGERLQATSGGDFVELHQITVK